MSVKDINVEDLRHLYETLGLSVHEAESSTGFTVHYLQNTFKDLPYTSPPFRPDYFSFLFIKDAFGKYTIDDKSFSVEPKTVYFTNPGNYRVFEWHKITDTCLITFNEAFLKEYVHADIFNQFSFLLTEIVEPQTLTENQFEVIEKMYRLIYEQHISNSPFKAQITGNLTVALLLKIKEYFFQNYNPIYEGNRSSLIVKTFKRNLENHFRELIAGKTDKQFRAQDYAELQALHVNYLSNVISTKTGKTISAWIADKTIAESKVLLQNPQLSIKEIAIMFGFSEAPHFSNYFKKNTLESPVEYRKTHLNHTS